MSPPPEYTCIPPAIHNRQLYLQSVRTTTLLPVRMHGNAASNTLFSREVRQIIKFILLVWTQYGICNGQSHSILLLLLLRSYPSENTPENPTGFPRRKSQQPIIFFKQSMSVCLYVCVFITFSQTDRALTFSNPPRKNKMRSLPIRFVVSWTVKIMRCLETTTQRFYVVSCSSWDPTPRKWLGPEL